MVLSIGISVLQALKASILNADNAYTNHVNQYSLMPLPKFNKELVSLLLSIYSLIANQNKPIA